MMHSHSSSRRQMGAALATSLIFLIVVTLLAISALQTSTLDSRLAENEQVRVESFQLAQATLDAVDADELHFPILAGTDYVSCLSTLRAAAAAEISCPAGADSLTLSGALFAQDLYIEVRRLQPEVFPMKRALKTSSAHFGLAGFGIRARTDRSFEGLGISDVEQGQIRLVRKDARVNY